MPARRVIDMRMHDGSRHFGSLPETYDPAVPQWEVLRDAVGKLAGAQLSGFVTDHVTEAWIDFTFAAQRFSINNQQGEWWFFAADPTTSELLLHEVLDHFEARLDPVPVPVPDGYTIGRARVDELAALPGIEDAAGVIFPKEDQQESVGGGLSPEFFLASATAGQLWVARTIAAPQPVGFAAATIVDACAHLHEIDVLPAHGRRGLGRALVGYVIEWARRSGYPSVTLTTFRHIAFNGPFYRSAGFVELADAELDPELAALRAAEGARGLDLTKRCAMRHSLGRDG